MTETATTQKDDAHRHRRAESVHGDDKPPTGKSVTYDCGKAGNAGKKACRG